MANGELITDFFPQGPYNWGITDTTKSPLKTLFTAVESAINSCQSAIAALAEQVTIQTATGVWLRNHAVLYGVTPTAGETDDHLRARVLAALTTKRITCPALEAYLTDWFATNYPSPPWNIVVCDLQTNPTLANQYGLVNCEFLVLLYWQLGIDDAFFLNYEYLNYTQLGLGTVFSVPDALFTPFMTRWKGAGFLPLWRNIIAYGYPEGEVTIADDASIVVSS
jgi:hypothetical protein